MHTIRLQHDVTLYPSLSSATCPVYTCPPPEARVVVRGVCLGAGLHHVAVTLVLAVLQSHV